MLQLQHRELQRQLQLHRRKLQVRLYMQHRWFFHHKQRQLHHYSWRRCIKPLHRKPTSTRHRTTYAQPSTCKTPCNKTIAGGHRLSGVVKGILIVEVEDEQGIKHPVQLPGTIVPALSRPLFSGGTGVIPRLGLQFLAQMFLSVWAPHVRNSR